MDENDIFSAFMAEELKKSRSEALSNRPSNAGVVTSWGLEDGLDGKAKIIDGRRYGRQIQMEWAALSDDEKFERWALAEQRSKAWEKDYGIVEAQVRRLATDKAMTEARIEDHLSSYKVNIQRLDRLTDRLVASAEVRDEVIRTLLALAPKAVQETAEQLLNDDTSSYDFHEAVQAALALEED